MNHLRILLFMSLLLFSLRADAKPTENIEVEADSASYSQSHNKVVLESNVNITGRGLVVTADSGTFFTEAKKGSLAGRVVLFDQEHQTKAYGNHLNIDYNAGQAVLAGDVKVVQKASDDTRVLTTERFIYRWEEGYGEAIGGVALATKDAHLESPKATWQQNQNKVVLTGGVRVNKKSGENFYAPTVSYDLDGERAVASGGVRATIAVPAKEEASEQIEESSTASDEAALVEPDYPLVLDEPEPEILLPGLDIPWEPVKEW